MRATMLALVIAVGLSAPVAAAEPSANAEMERKRSEEVGLEPGMTLDASTAHLAKGMLPDEILAYYEKGEWKNRIAAWPVGIMKYEKEFLDGVEQNRGNLDLDEQGGIIDKRTGEQPPYIIGFPFPDIDPANPKAGAKVYWNFLYQNYNVGNSRNVVDLTWVSPDGVDRVSGQEVYFFYYDAQKKKYVPEKNPQNLLQQFIATTQSPQDLYGTTALGWRFRDPGKRDNNWAYVPALRRIRALSPANRSDGFLGSDMSQDDGPFFDGKTEDFEWKLAGEAEMLRLADPNSLEGKTDRRPHPKGGYRTVFAPPPFAGFEDPTWTGVPWAPVAPVLVKRKAWIIEATPKDRYYLYGKIQLYFDQETFQGMWNRKYSWTGENLNTSMALGYLNSKSVAPDGTEDWLWGASMAFQTAINLKMNRATVTGWAHKGRDKFETIVNDRRMMYDPSFFDYQTLYRFGK